MQMRIERRLRRQREGISYTLLLSVTTRVKIRFQIRIMSFSYPNNDDGIIIEFPFHIFAYFPIIKEVIGKNEVFFIS